MEIKNRIYNNTLYVLLHGELDEHSAAATRIKLDDIFKSTGFRQIIIDLSELDFMDSSGIALILNVNKRICNIGGRLRVENVARQPMKVIKASGVERIVSIKEQ